MVMLIVIIVTIGYNNADHHTLLLTLLPSLMLPRASFAASGLEWVHCKHPSCHYYYYHYNNNYYYNILEPIAHCIPFFFSLSTYLTNWTEWNTPRYTTHLHMQTLYKPAINSKYTPTCCISLMSLVFCKSLVFFHSVSCPVFCVAEKKINRERSSNFVFVSFTLFYRTKTYLCVFYKTVVCNYSLISHTDIYHKPFVLFLYFFSFL